MEGFLKPEEILKQLNLKEEMTAVDFGSGSGGWAIPLAKILKEGEVYAIDVLEEPLSALKGKANLSNISNIKTIRADIERDKGSGLKDNSLDLVLITNLLFQIEEKEKVVKEAKRVVKKEGKILIVDWKVDSSFGPKEGKISAEAVKKIAKELGLQFKKEIGAGGYHYGLLFEKT
ncbi:MAG TPA: SAM-dependent methyltransferase [Candidatus Nealsonbacteria bacterium]|uniref:Methyltransferase domain-containing protein n=1 Tax=marine sediment metagenome TaxID=412755 RepID=A0A0F9XIE5_9ZZZZ|nr:SAM-dependent methyltransferase [Candidatus Nealsonbacteria bacterium]HEB46813.1 SAM-dependent methyltransferase [Candidatus Nealsonbacteria bacterium]